MRVALVSPGISVESGGTSALIAALASHLCDAGHAVSVISTSVGPTPARSETVISLDSRVNLNLFPITKTYDRKLYRSSALQRWLQDRITDFDVVDLTGVWSMVTVQTAGLCLKAGVPFVLTPHGQMCGWDWSKGPIRKRLFFHALLANAWKRAAAIRFCSEGEAAVSVAAPNDMRRIVVPNPVDLPTNLVRGPQREALRIEAGIGPGAPTLLFLGRVDAQKGVLEIVDTFTNLWQKRRNAILLIAGPVESAYGQKVLEAVRQSPAKASIRITGPVYGHEKQNLFTISDLFLTLSKNEGLPMAVLEALSSGLPAVLTANSNMPEVTEYDAGLVVDCGPAEIAEKIDNLFTNATILSALQENARRLIRERFSWEILMPRFVSMYQEAIMRTRRASGRLQDEAAMAD
jgi:glycosyltransferase involved in cell wall biosynthesis